MVEEEGVLAVGSLIDNTPTGEIAGEAISHTVANLRFSNEIAARKQKFRYASGEQLRNHVPVPRSFTVRRIGEDEVKLLLLATGEREAIRADDRGVRELRAFQILTSGTTSGRGGVHHADVRGAPAQRFQSYRTGTAEKIKYTYSGEDGGKDVEESFANTVLGRTHLALGDQQGHPPGAAGNDFHAEKLGVLPVRYFLCFVLVLSAKKNGSLSRATAWAPVRKVYPMQRNFNAARACLR